MMTIFDNNFMMTIYDDNIYVRRACATIARGATTIAHAGRLRHL